MHRKRIITFVLIALMPLMSFGCSLQSITPDKVYLASTEEFNTFVQRYLVYYQQQPAEVKAEMDNKYGKLIDDAFVAHDLWRIARSANKPIDPATVNAFLDAKNKLIDIGFELWGKEGG